MQIAQLDVNLLVGICSTAMVGSLFDKLSPMSQDQGLRGIPVMWDAVYKLGEDDLRQSGRGTGLSYHFVPFFRFPLRERRRASSCHPVDKLEQTEYIPLGSFAA